MMKWYNNERLIELLCFAFPPLGIYALVKNETIRSKPKKILLAIVGTMGFLFFIYYMV